MTIEAMKQAQALICSARLCEVNSMSSRQEILRLMSEAADTLRAAIDHAERPQTHSEECWRWHHECAVEKIKRMPAVKLRPEHFADIIKGKEVLQGPPAYWTEWPTMR